jgi:hypothetical protein
MLKPGDLVYVHYDRFKPHELWAVPTWTNIDTCGTVSDGDVGLFISGPVLSDHPGDIEHKISFVLCLFGTKVGWVYPDILKLADEA